MALTNNDKRTLILERRISRLEKMIKNEAKLPLTWDGGYFVTGRTNSNGLPELFNLDWLAEKCRDYGVDWLTSRFDISKADLDDIMDRADELSELDEWDEDDEDYESIKRVSRKPAKNEASRKPVRKESVKRNIRRV